MNVLHIDKVTKSFGRKPVLSDVSLLLKPGEHLLLTGPSGGGKTTLLRIIAGLESCESGSVVLAGECVTRADQILIAPHKRGLAMVFQDLGLWPNLSVRDNVLLGLAGLELSKTERLIRADRALKQCEIQSHSNVKPARLSGGELQRVALARALAVQPRLLLLDEPFSGLDLTLRRSLINHLKAVAESGATSIVWVSHDPRDSLPMGASIAVLEHGNVIECGSYEAITSQPRSETMKAWLSE